MLPRHPESSLAVGSWIHKLCLHIVESWGSQLALVVKNPPVSAGDTGSVPGLGRSPGGGNGNTLQYSCLGNCIDRGAWLADYSPWGLKRVGYDLATEHARTVASRITVFERDEIISFP